MTEVISVPSRLSGVKGIALVALIGSLGCAQAQGQELSAAIDGKRPSGLNAQNAEAAAPIQLFDNLYYVGNQYVAAYVITTDAGLIMIDTLYDRFTDITLQAMRDVGLDPADIEYVLVSHGHGDHYGGARAVQAVSGARVGMSAADWEMMRADTGETSPVEGDFVIDHGDTLSLGNTTLSLTLTPGHTPGVTSFEFPVYDDGQEYKAYLFGGHNVTGRSVDAWKMFVASVKDIQATVSGVHVNLTSHPWAALIFERAEQLASRQAGEPHPFVLPDDFTAFIDERLEFGEARLEEVSEAADAPQ